LSSRIAYGPPIYSDRSTFTANLVGLILSSIIFLPIAFSFYYYARVDCWRECEELCKLEYARCNMSLLSCKASAGGVSVECGEETILIPLVPLIPVLVFLLITLRGPIEVLLYEDMLVVRGGPLAGGDRRITRHEVTRVTLRFVKFEILAIFIVCVKSPSNTVCTYFYGMKPAMEFVEAIKRVWGIHHTLESDLIA